MNEAARFEQVETRLAYLERALQDLSDVVYRQQRELDLAHERQRQMAEQLAGLDGTVPGGPGTERPPHY